ncbi:two-component system sensor histidine kinase NtrB [Crateriforma conspicua]|uniref:two-component system sensor histidine kinase NtrB n=1 Tax=Crateriforma conspicua TaxID=2527996 RepID=UPI00118CD1C8|nr:ATP-binding protein [Crateriforma conspicua]QDV61851.1 Wide host range VirA protein [Crateriforma conspicua]
MSAERFLFPASVALTLIYTLGSLWIGVRRIDDTDRLERRIESARMYRNTLGDFQRVISSATTRVWRFHVTGNEVDRALAQQRLSDASDDVMRLADLEQHSLSESALRFGSDTAQASLQAVRRIIQHPVQGDDQLEATETLKRNRDHANAVIDLIDQDIESVKPLLSRHRTLIRSLLVYGQLVMIGLLALIFLTQQAEKRLRSESGKEQLRYTTLLSEIPEPIHIEDPSGAVVYWNAGAEKLFGIPAEQMIGRNADSVIDLGFGDDEQASGRLQHYDRAKHWNGEVWAKNAAGKSIHLERRRTRVMDGRQCHGVVVLDLDLAERKRLQAVDRRRQRLESLGTLASGIAHDLNNVLTPILMSSKMLARHDPKINQDALIDTITQGASRAAGLIDQLLTFARGGEGQHVDLDLAGVLHDTETILQRTLKPSINLRLEVADAMPMIHGDETEISQVVMNLAINARDAMPDGGTLAIRTSVQEFSKERLFSFTPLPPGRYVRIEVSDTGHGIAPENRERIFEPFFSTKERGQGTGLGLSTSLGIIKSHRGAVEVKSVPGEGTTIAVLLPAR